MKRKIRVLTLCAMLFALGVPVQAQQLAKTPRIALLVPSTATGYASRIEAFRRGLGNLGYVEGKNIVVEYRYTKGKSDQASRFLAELIGLHVDVIVTSSTSTVLRAKKATQTTPIVFVAIGDPVANGVVDSLARPGLNLTGLSNLAPELGGKRLELLKEVVPRLSRVAILAWNRNSPGTAAQLKELEVAAPALNLMLQRIDTPGPGAADLESALKAMTTGRPQALLSTQSPTFATFRERIADFAITNRLPAMYAESSFPEAGGLLSYGADSQDFFRRAATYVDKILKGAKPADLPVEQPTKFELVINLKAAKQIGLTMPPNVLARADKVIK
jgi:ABC-type uncharacterized transport system substrate-binding protein